MNFNVFLFQKLIILVKVLIQIKLLFIVVAMIFIKSYLIPYSDIKLYKNYCSYF
jgi:hypothetical protein